MKKYIIGFLLLWINISFGDETGRYFDLGNEQYQNDLFEEAIASYGKVLELGYENGPLYFNLGNCYYKTGQYGRARLYYEKAGKFIKNDEALKENMQLVKLHLVDQIEEPPRFILAVWQKSVLDLFTVTLLSWLVAIFLWLFLGLYAFYLYKVRRGSPEPLRIIKITVLIIFIFFVLILSRKIYIQETEQHALIMKPSVTVFAEPDINGTEVFVLHEGTKVQIRRDINGWFEIRLADGKTGWLKQEQLEII